MLVVPVVATLALAGPAGALGAGRGTVQIGSQGFAVGNTTTVVRVGLTAAGVNAVRKRGELTTTALATIDLSGRRRHRVGWCRQGPRDDPPQALAAAICR